MVLIFDLDDTLYDEMTFVVSGLYAVANYGEVSFGWEAKASFAFLHANLLMHGRGAVFDEWLRSHGRYSVSRVRTCVNVYRHHKPKISLFSAATRVLEHYREQTPLYLVTDGHKVVQKNKIDSLNLTPIFKRIFITHRFAIRHAKPSLHCFEIIRRSENCDWSDMVYVGDNPAKDFVSLKTVGAKTVRVLTGSYSHSKAPPDYDADVTISDLSQLPFVLENSPKEVTPHCTNADSMLMLPTS